MYDRTFELLRLVSSALHPLYGGKSPGRLFDTANADRLSGRIESACPNADETRIAGAVSAKMEVKWNDMVDYRA